MDHLADPPFPGVGIPATSGPSCNNPPEPVPRGGAVEHNGIVQAPSDGEADNPDRQSTWPAPDAPTVIPAAGWATPPNALSKASSEANTP